jgi:mRNA interferase RelE/StbE
LAWSIEFEDTAAKQFRRLDATVQRRILSYLSERVSPSEDPKKLAEPLTGPFQGLWRYRVGDYRVVCKYEKERLIVVVVQIGHRREVYRQ